MKFLFSIALFFLSYNSMLAEIIKYKDGYEEIVLTNITKNQMWNNLNEWIALNVDSYKYAVDYQDKESGRLILKVIAPETVIPTPINACCIFTIQFDLKDNKYRIRLFGNVQMKPKGEDATEERMKRMGLLDDDIQLFWEICEAFFNKSLTWTMNDTPEAVLSKFENELAETPKYNSPKDEKKGKISGGYQYLANVISIIENIINYYNLSADYIVQGVKSAIIINDDF